MADVNTLQNDAQNLRMQAEQMRKDATVASQTASDYVKDGDGNRAQQEQTKATSYLERAQQLEQEAMKLDQKAHDVQQQVAELDTQKSQIQQKAQQQINDIDKQQERLTGSSGGGFF